MHCTGSENVLTLQICLLGSVLVGNFTAGLVLDVVIEEDEECAMDIFDGISYRLGLSFILRILTTYLNHKMKKGLILFVIFQQYSKADYKRSLLIDISSSAETDLNHPRLLNKHNNSGIPEAFKKAKLIAYIKLGFNTYSHQYV